MVKIGISACLAGQPVRYDGTHKRRQHIIDFFADKALLVPVCPETGCGLGVPREPIRLTGNPQTPRLKTTQTQRDVTAKMQAWLEPTLTELVILHDIKGFILKARSPSCGYNDAPVWRPNGTTVTGWGLFALNLHVNLPHVVCASEETLQTTANLENFWRKIQAAG